MKKLLITSLLSFTLVTGCSNTNVRETLGFNREAPDEFMVQSHPVLEVPENLTALPLPGAAPSDIGENKIAQSAKETLFGSRGSSSKSASAGENALLSKAGADQASATIRKELYVERKEAEATRVQREESTLGSLNPYSQVEKDPVVDAKAEAERLKELQEKGEPITSKGVKEKDRKPKAPLEDLF